MIPALVLALIGWSVWLAFVFGRITADRRVDTNHYELVMFSILLRSRDDVFPLLSIQEREQLNRLIDDYTFLGGRADE